MSSENVELIRAMYEAMAAGESLRPFVAEDLEYVNPPDAVEPGTRHGYRTLTSVLDVYPDFHVELERVVDLGDEVLVLGTAHGTGASGVEIHMRQGYIWAIRDGKAVRLRWFTDPDDALAAAGIAD